MSSQVHRGREYALKKAMEVDAVMDHLISEGENIKNQVTEKVFVESFLPQLVDPEKFDFHSWNKLPAGPIKPLEVYRDDGTELLFTVPALLRDIDPYDRGTVNIGRLLEDAAARAEVDHRLGDERIQEAARLFRGVPQDLTAIVTMNNIFRRYGYPEVPLPDGVTLDHLAPASADPDTVEDSDDFVEL